jgi:glutathione-regulated potassium-efflux system protein KefB
MDQDQLSREELQLALKTFRQAAIFVRAYDRRALIEYKGLDTAEVIREVFESAVVMGRKALTALGVSEQRVAEIETAYRTRDKARLRVQLEKGLFAEEARSITFRADNPLAVPREP